MINFDLTWGKFSPTNSMSEIVPIGEDAKYVEMSVRVIPDWNVSVTLDWEVPDIDEALDEDYVYHVYYSESELGPFLQLTTQPTSDTAFFTAWQVQDSKVYEQYFTIELHNTAGQVFRSYPMTPNLSLPAWHQRRSRDIIRREAILLDKFVGVDSIVRTRKHRGLRCKSCWDPVHLKVTNDHCETCFGTSYEGGYDTGMRTKLQYTSIDPQSNYSYQGTEEPCTISAWGLPFPLLHPGAIILRPGDRKLFRVEGHQGSTEMLTNVQRQTVVLRELGRDSVENKLFNSDDVIDVMPRKNHVHQ